MNKKFLFTAVTFPAVLLGTAFAALEGNNKVVHAEDEVIYTLDYTTSDEDVKIIDGKTIIKALVDNPSQEEIDYVNKHYQLKYNLPKFNFKEIENEEVIDQIKVSSNSNEVFTSKEVKVGETSYLFDQSRDEHIDAAVIPSTNVDDAEVVYTHKIKLNDVAAKEIANAAYNAGKKEIDKEEAHKAYEERLSEVEQYEEDIQKYNEYQLAHYEWSIQNEIYQNYAKHQESYLEAKKAYDEYLGKLATYENELNKYKKYLADVETYNTNKALADEIEKQFQAEFDVINFQLGVMDLIYQVFPNVEDGGTLYSYIFRDAVDQVLTRQNELKVLGVSTTAIKQAAVATTALRGCFRKYDDLRKAKDKAAMYEYYTNNFHRIRQSIVSLAQCLEKFLTYDSVIEILRSNGKLERYAFLVAELIYIGECFSDVPIMCYDAAYALGGESYVLDHNFILLDKTVSAFLGVEPIEKTYSMQTVATYPVDVSVMYGAKPNYRDYNLTSDSRPVKPEEVLPPTILEKENPAGEEPKPQDFGLTSNVRPQKPLILEQEPEDRDETYDDVYTLVKTEQLKERKTVKTEIELEESINLTSAKQEEASISKAKVTFKNGDTVMYQASDIEVGAHVNYGGVAPTKIETKTARYEFAGWEVNGEPVTLPLELTEDVVLDAKFNEIKKFDIKFIFGDDLSHSITVEEGETPTAPDVEAVDKKPEIDTYYEFAGWSPTLVSASEGCTYEAQYTSKKIISNATIAKVDDSLQIVVDEKETTLDLTKFMELVNEGYQVFGTSIKFDDVVIELSQADMFNLITNQVRTLKLEKTISPIGETIINFVLLDKNDEEVEVKIEVEVFLKEFKEIENVIAKTDGDKLVSIKSYKEGLTFTMSANSKVTLGVYYKVAIDDYSTSIFKIDGVEVAAGSYVNVLKGQKIIISATAPAYSEIANLLALRSDLSTIKNPDASSMSLTVTENATIYANLKKVPCTINLKMDGDVAFTFQVAYGSKIVLPSLIKQGTNEYFYSFQGYEGITSTIYEVKGDATLNAVFVKTKIDDDGKIEDSSTSIVKVAAFIALGVMFLGSAVAVIIVATKKQKQK